MAFVRLDPECIRCLLKKHLNAAPESAAKEARVSYMQRMLRLIADASPFEGAPVLVSEIEALQKEMFGIVRDFSNEKKAFNELKELGADSPEELRESRERDKEYNVEFWGKSYGTDSEPYTDADYDALNRVYDAMAEGRSGLSTQSQIAIQDIARWTLERDKLMANKEFDDAKKVDAMIEKLKESEQLRKKDELPQDRARLDDIIKACERAGLNLMDYEELKRQLATYMFHTPYGYTRDAADQMLLYIRNATAFNEGVAEVDRLPNEFAIVDTLGEFAQERDDQEKQTYKELGIQPLRMKPGK